MEVMGSVSVESAFVMTPGLVITAAVQWKQLPVRQQTSSCVTGGGCVVVEPVNVSHNTQAPPVRFALLVLVHVCSIWPVWSVGLSEWERRRTGKSWLIVKRHVVVPGNEALQLETSVNDTYV